ncbi:unnamed protein product [Schistocephalus solidus]|uniref:Uncharacterized protein n=1 Tax=Schistocephalus solidus TaxID=70667 RepID=A0A183TDA0_SCHSO|nr:unnamed protein product [Schistocephalus solidus]
MLESVSAFREELVSIPPTLSSDEWSSTEFWSPSLSFYELCTVGQLRGDLIQTYRIIRGRECALEFADFFELAETQHLWGHPFKLQTSPTLENLDTFLQFCNPDDGLEFQLMIEAGSDGFASLIGGLCSQQGRISMRIS